MVANLKPEIARFLKDEGKVILSFSCGKDSLTCWCLLEELGIEIVPFYMQMIPGLSWIEDYLGYVEYKFGRPVIRTLNPLLYDCLRGYTAQPPHRKDGLDLLALPGFKYEDVERGVRRTAAMRTGDSSWEQAWVAVGTKWTDNPLRRRSFDKWGWKRDSTRKVYPIYDLRKEDLVEVLNRHDVKLPDCYRMYGRSFEGIDHRFLDGIREDHPEDYARILEWFPLIEAEFLRAKWAAKHGCAVTK